MTEISRKALLPAGLEDILPPDAAFESTIATRLLACFASHGYERVKPPLVEFEEGLLSGTGASLSDQTFRLMDPISQRMMAVRSDVTPQIARIAQSRLARSPRPLRLSYAEDILRVRGSELRTARQFGQVGYELIGAAGPAADAEVILLAAEGLRALGLGALTIDLNAPTLVTAILDQAGFEPAQRQRLRGALDRKDPGEVAALGGPVATPLIGLLEATGPAGLTFARLARLALPGAAREEAEALGAVLALLTAAAPDLRFTIDPVEHRGFEYQTGVSFSLFVAGARAELGRGGRYRLEGNGAGPGEPATGCTLYLDVLLRELPRPVALRRLFLPFGTEAARAAAWRADGWMTIAGMAPVKDIGAEARRLGCTHLLDGEQPVALGA
jgi:ATP phosphoribosyltransferase regulatory subunit